MLVIAVVLALPRMRQTALLRPRQRELDQRRETVASEHRSEAGAPAAVPYGHAATFATEERGR